MLQKFFTNTLSNTIVKDIINHTPLPLFDTIRIGDILYKGYYYIYKTYLLLCTSSGLFVGFGDDNTLNNTLENSTLSAIPLAAVQTVSLNSVSINTPYKSYNLSEYIPNISKKYLCNSSNYTTQEHLYLGKYLRCIRDIYDIDLMHLYNCFTYKSYHYFNFHMPEYELSPKTTETEFSLTKLLTNNTNNLTQIINDPNNSNYYIKSTTLASLESDDEFIVNYDPSTKLYTYFSTSVLTLDTTGFTKDILWIHTDLESIDVSYSKIDNNAVYDLTLISKSPLNVPIYLYYSDRYFYRLTLVSSYITDKVTNILYYYDNLLSDNIFETTNMNIESLTTGCAIVTNYAYSPITDDTTDIIEIISNITSKNISVDSLQEDEDIIIDTLTYLFTNILPSGTYTINDNKFDEVICRIADGTSVVIPISDTGSFTIPTTTTNILVLLLTATDATLVSEYHTSNTITVTNLTSSININGDDYDILLIDVVLTYPQILADELDVSTIAPYIQSNFLADTKSFLVPIKYNKEYTIAIENSSTMLVWPVLWCDTGLLKYNDLTYLQDSDNFKSWFTPSIYRGVRFNQPVKFSIPLYRKTSDDTWEFNEEAYKYQDNLYLLILLPNTNNSSIVILEGDYVKEKHAMINCGKLSKIAPAILDNLLFTKPAITRINDQLIYAYNDKLITYLLHNVITNREDIENNISRVEDQLSLPDTGYIKYSDDIWNNIIRAKAYYDYLYRKTYSSDITADNGYTKYRIVYRVPNNSKLTLDKYDINGFIDTQIEKLINKK